MKWWIQNYMYYIPQLKKVFHYEKKRQLKTIITKYYEFP